MKKMYWLSAEFPPPLDKRKYLTSDLFDWVAMTGIFNPKIV